MKVWEEEWRAVAAAETGGSNELHWGDGQHHCLPWGYDAEDMAAARLAAAAPDMARLLLEIEWNGFRVDGRGECPSCSALAEGEHLSDCELVAVLVKAGVRAS